MINVKTRFAPSPTGNLHIGNVRTALYAWLFARKHQGKFILRIEDSDSKRLPSNSVSNIISELNWLNLDWDEGPYFQTNRFNRYHSIIDYMLKKGIAYKCYCSNERLKFLRDNQIKNKQKPKYDGYCRVYNKTVNQKKNFYFNKSYVIRFRNPEFGKVTFLDQILGKITFNNQELDDLIICRSDGSPTYNFCVVVDDMDMNITHVIRGSEHINNTPRQINILKALNVPVPIYAHVSMILNNDRSKLSKRYGKTLSILQYRNAGFLPEAILNYSVRLGWSYGNQEIFSIDQMKEFFNFQDISRSASIFNMKKLLWFNHYYINHLSSQDIAFHLSWHMLKNNIDIKKGPKLTDIVKLFSKRSYTLKDIVNGGRFFYENFDVSQKKVYKDYFIPELIEPFNLLKIKLIGIVDWTPESIQLAIRDTINMLNIKINQIGIALRIFLIGTHKSPALSDIIYVIGRSVVLNRIDQAINFIRDLISKKI